MKQSIVKIFTFSLLVSSISFISCVDNEKNLFNADQLKQIYEETFPVKNIDSDGDWTMSRSVTAHVSINGDQSKPLIQPRTTSMYSSIFWYEKISRSSKTSCSLFFNDFS